MSNPELQTFLRVSDFMKEVAALGFFYLDPGSMSLRVGLYQGSIQELVFWVNMKEHPVALEYGYVDFLYSLLT